MRCEHKDLGLKHCSVSEREVYSHLVTIEVGVESRTYEWVETYSLTFHEFRLERLNTKAVQCRSTVKEYRVAFQDILKNIPYHRVLTVNNFLC